MGSPKLKVVGGASPEIVRNDMLDRAIALWNTRDEYQWSDVQREVGAVVEGGTEELKAFTMEVRRRAKTLNIKLRLGRRGRPQKCPPANQFVIYSGLGHLMQYAAVSDWRIFAQQLADEHETEVMVTRVFEMDCEAADDIANQLNGILGKYNPDTCVDVLVAAVMRLRELLPKIEKKEMLQKSVTVTPDWRKQLN